MKTLDVVIPSIGREHWKYTYSCLEALIKQQSLEKVVRLYLVEDINRWGACFCRNTGAFLGKWDYIAFMDDDVVPDLNYFKSFFDFIKDHPEIDIIQGRVIGNWSDNQCFTSKTQMFVTASLFVKREVFSQLPFNNVLNGNGFEDLAYCRDALKMWFKIAYNPNSKVAHFGDSWFVYKKESISVLTKMYPERVKKLLKENISYNDGEVLFPYGV